MPYLAPRFFPGFLVRGKSISLEILRIGYAQVYTQAGAEYGDYGKERLLQIEAQAKLVFF